MGLKPGAQQFPAKKLGDRKDQKLSVAYTRVSLTSSPHLTYPEYPLSSYFLLQIPSKTTLPLTLSRPLMSALSSHSAAAQAKLGDPSGNSNASYWDAWFTDVSSGASFEWYCSPAEILAIMKELFQPGAVLLHAGTGNSELMFDAVDWYGKAVCMDVSSVAIEEMNAKKALKLPSCSNITFALGDVLDTLLPLRDLNSGVDFDGVVDKGLMDAMMSSFDPSYQSNSDKLFTNANQVMKVGASYLCVSLAEEVRIEWIQRNKTLR